jgi:hypothetical protein
MTSALGYAVGLFIFDKVELHVLSSKTRVGVTRRHSCSEHIPNQDTTISTHTHHLLAVRAKSYASDCSTVTYTLSEKSTVCGVPYAHTLVSTSCGQKTPTMGDSHASWLEVSMGVVCDKHGARVREIPKRDAFVLANGKKSGGVGMDGDTIYDAHALYSRG